jgi:hypothetical protein
MKWRRHKVTGNQDPRSKYSSNRFTPRPWDPNYRKVREGISELANGMANNMAPRKNNNWENNGNNRSNWENNGTRNRGVEWHRSTRDITNNVTNKKRPGEGINEPKPNPTRGYDRHHVAVEIANNVTNKKRPGEGINAPKPTERYDRSVHVSGTGSSRTRRRRGPSRRPSSSSRG